MIRPSFKPTAAALLVPVLLAGCAGGFHLGGPPPLRATENACHDTNFPIYFDRGSDQLTADARTLISAVGVQMKACRVASAEVVGLAGAGGPTEQASLELSRRRADVVGRALADAALPVPKIDLLAEGASGAVTPRGRPEPLRRRTEVIIHVSK